MKMSEIVCNLSLSSFGWMPNECFGILTVEKSDLRR
jgi:hypothetical protein